MHFGAGNLMVGKAYTAQLGLEPGDEFEIKLGASRSSSSLWARLRRSEGLLMLSGWARTDNSSASSHQHRLNPKGSGGDRSGHRQHNFISECVCWFPHPAFDQQGMGWLYG